MKKINIFCFGFGQVAKNFIYNLSKTYDVNLATTSRDETKEKKIYGINYTSYHFLDNSFDRDILKKIKNYDYILVSIPPKNGIDIVVKNFQETLETTKTYWITYLSATSVYGNHNGKWVDEKSKVNPLTENGKSRLSAEKSWLSLAKKKKLPIQIFRLSGIYSQEKNIFKRIKSGSHQIINSSNHFFSRIHVEDISNLLQLTLENKNIIPGEIYNLSDDYPCSTVEVANYAYDMMKILKPKMIEINEIESEMLKNFYQDSKKVSNNKIKKVFSYKLKFPTYKEGLRNIFNHII